MHSPGINGGELRGQPANKGSPGKMAVKNRVCMCVFDLLAIGKGQVQTQNMMLLTRSQILVVLQAFS